MHVFGMNPVLAGVLWIDVVPYEIQRRHHEIVHADIQVVDVGQRQKSIVHRIDQNECGDHGQSASGECDHTQIEIVEKCDRFRAEATQHPKEHNRHAKEQECGPIEAAGDEE